MKIYNGEDKAREEGYKNYEDRLRKLRVGNMQWSGEIGVEMPVKARIDYGRWVADCECGGCEYVSPDYPHFYCLSCGNKSTGGKSRPVIFPPREARARIEAALLKVTGERFGGNEWRGTQAALHTRYMPGGMNRNWDDNISVDELEEKVKKHVDERRINGLD